MKPQYLFILCILMGCQKPKSESQITSITPENKTKTVVAVPEKFLKTDTISITEGEESAANSYILANLVGQKADKDSIVTAKYQLDFYQNKTKTASSKITIKGIEKGSEWGASYGLTSATAKNSSFVQISFGYPACGYMQSNYLYYLKTNDLQLVHQWDSMTDSGWGSWVEFENPSAKANPESFYCKTVSFEPDDNDENMGTVTHSDSIVFRLSGNSYKKELLSAKDKTYFEKKMSFDAFHNQK
ncbi:hypothetical protein [Flavobacterium pectinovorum]|uniref:Uncharacterized protein n=1 Tax=Flavobacterium pectinovorum TaxID=29533 RepID=A0A502EGQ5_9FLAO|nr:hypothetical protein [Flavobacterium pectinovorum]TPG36374.1 hypothetical protein EAH81_20090 [Flavobacterium pectinovorum]